MGEAKRKARAQNARSWARIDTCAGILARPRKPGGAEMSARSKPLGRGRAGPRADAGVSIIGAAMKARASAENFGSICRPTATLANRNCVVQTLVSTPKLKRGNGCGGGLLKSLPISSHQPVVSGGLVALWISTFSTTTALSSRRRLVKKRATLIEKIYAERGFEGTLRWIEEIAAKSCLTI
jgi:hypothetical protein